MFAILGKGRMLCLDIDTQVHLFDAIIVPILLYGCEIWGFTNMTGIERIQTRFCKMLLKVKKSTPNVMIQGELGLYPLHIKVKTRMVAFWAKLVTGVHDKYIYQLYNCILQLQCSKWVCTIQSILDNCGLSWVWLSQGENVNVVWLKKTVEQSNKDQFLQEWHHTLSNSNKCVNYRNFKNKFQFENYLVALPLKWRINMAKFRCRSNKLPIEEGIFNKTSCMKCDLKEIGDEFHYIFKCPSLQNERTTLLPETAIQHPSAFWLNKLLNMKGNDLVKICKFISHILKEK